jgi:RNA polymerase sigma factor (sigma-70 family)
VQDEFIASLYERYFDVVFKYCLPRLRFDESAAADCAHAVFDAALEKREKLSRHPNPAGWLMLTARHMVHKRWTRDAKSAAESIPLDLLTAIPDKRDPFDAIELSDSDISRITEAVLSGLNENEALIYGLYFKEDLPIPEIAKRIGISEKAAHARLDRVKAKLKRRIIYFLNE